MDDVGLQHQIEAARAYEALFVPALFEQYATKVADAVGVGKGERVLDVACGTGVLAREMLRRVGPGGRVAVSFCRTLPTNGNPRSCLKALAEFDKPTDGGNEEGFITKADAVFEETCGMNSTVRER